MRFFYDLGRRTEELWRRYQHDAERFPEVARAALAEVDWSKAPDTVSIARAMVQGHMPFQVRPESQFGEPPLTVYRDDRFYIEVLFWLDGTTAIHQHAFEGAFRVLTGSSIHGVYNFEIAERINERLLIGAIKNSSIELLRAGSCREIEAGTQYVHSLFHLDRPSTTVVVRTFQNPAHKPAWAYLRPAIARDHFDQSPTRSIRLRCLRMLRQADPVAGKALLAEYCLNCDFDELVDIFHSGTVSSDDLELAEHCLESARQRHGSRCDILRSVITEARRESNIRARRAIIKNPEHRFFLALLMTAPGRRRTLELASQWDQSAEGKHNVLRWLGELSQGSGGDAPESSPLGIRLSRSALEIVSLLLDGRDGDEALEILAQRHPSAVSGPAWAELPAVIKVIQGSPVLRSLFEDVQ
jgi:hypothetical protein